MQYLLDTNICIHFFKGKFNLLNKLENVGLSNCSISEITLAELVYGAENSSNPAKNYELIESFTAQITVLSIFSSIPKYGKEKARLRQSGNMISDFDLLIGCTSVVNKLIMVTENIAEFERISEIKIENWIVR
jgi:tRNA(fMet)-specific endonuclease VapC